MKRRLKVLRFSHSATLSAYRERERALNARDDLEIALCCPKKWDHLGNANSVDEIHEQFLCTRVTTYGTGSIPLFTFDPFPFIGMLRHFQPDIVDIHEEPYSASCFEALLLSKQFAPQAKCTFYSAQNIKKKYPPPFSFTEKFVYRNSAAAYPCSEGVQEVLLAKGYKQPCPVIPLGFAPKDFAPSAAPLAIPQSNSSYKVGYTGRLEDCKGVDYLLRAVAELDNVVLIVAGIGTVEKKLRELSATLGIADRVHWLGELPALSMPSFYTACDTVVVPSITTPTWREQFGRVVVEAMACGTPIIASASGSLLEVTGDAGMLVPEQDHRAIADAIKSLRDQTDLRQSLIQKGLQRVHENYSWEQVAAVMARMYRQAMSDEKMPGEGTVHQSEALSTRQR